MLPAKYNHSGIHAFAKGDDPAPEVPGETDDLTIDIPDDEGIQAVSDDELDEDAEGSLANKLLAGVDAMDEVSDPEALATLSKLVEGVNRVRAEKARRDEVRTNAQQEAAKLRAQVHGDPEADEDEGEDDGDVEADDTVEAAAPEAPVAEPTQIAAAAAPRVTTPGPVRLNISMAEVRRRAPQPDVAPRLAITAAADVPKIHAGHQFETVQELATAFHERAKSAALTASGEASGPKVATIHRQYQHNVSVNTSEAQMAQIIKSLTDPQSLVAAGGWCAPSEVSYDFFDITCEDGMIDLPTFGVSRGGIRWPTSPGLADVFTGAFTNLTNPWLWTETDDILAATGAGVKPCVRVPCPAFNDARLEDYGICLTAGNLTDAAFPEAIEHQLGLLQSAHYHAMNQRYIALVIAMSTVVATGGFFDDASAISADLPFAVEWAAIDYRTRHGMCENAVLEVILPKWARAAMRGDLAYRTGVDLLAVTDLQIDNYFDVRSVRVQWVNDWQVRGTDQPGGAVATTLIPTTVRFAIYAAGTFGLGNGPSLDLGVVRDSTLNSKNDHTAAWSEEAHLIAKFGNESRVYTVSICAAGRTGIANLAACHTSAA